MKRPETENAVTNADVASEIEKATSGSIDAASDNDDDLVAVKHIVDGQAGNQRAKLIYVVLPPVFLLVTLLGGIRISGSDGSFIFVRPALVCLVFASVLLILFFRAGLIRLDGWFSEEFTTVKNAANGAVLLTLFAATTQLFNSLLPEQGLPFWIVAFCFFWTLWNNLFADFDTKRLLRSLAAMFGLAFVVKYLLLANLAAPADQSWLRTMIENPAEGAFTWLLDLPRFASATGYLQFFAVFFYVAGLYFLPSSSNVRDLSERQE